MESQSEDKLENQCCQDLHWIKEQMLKAHNMKVEMKNKLAKIEEAVDAFTDVLNNYTQ